MSRIMSMSLAGAAGILFTACASTPPAPQYDSNLSATEQAPMFITAASTRSVDSVQRVAVTSCNVMFADVSSATASTGGGIFDDTNRAEASVSVIYSLKGLDNNQLQRLADEVCADAEAQLAEAGYDVVPRSALAGVETFQELQTAGRESPYEYKMGASTYKVFARSGESVFDERYIGTAAGLGQAFRAAAGGSAWQLEAVTLETLEASGVNINIMLDFAALTSSGQGAAGGGFVSRDTAEVSGEVRLSAAGELAFKPFSQLDCWNRFGNRECMVNANHIARFSNHWPVVIPQTFYTDVVDATTTGDAVAGAVTSALAFLGGGTSRDITRYDVNAIPARYAEISRLASQAFVEMAVTQAATFK